MITDLLALRFRLLGVLCLASWCGAQTVWTVPNGRNLASYIAQAAPGDVLLLGATHPGFTLDKGLTLRPASGRSLIQDSNPLYWRSTLSVPAGQLASLRELDFVSGQSMFVSGLPALTVSGVAHFEDCSVSGSQGPAVSASNTVMSMRGCRLQGTYQSEAVVLSSGFNSFVSCSFAGSNGVNGSTLETAPRAAVVIHGGYSMLSNCTLTPGLAVPGTYAPIVLGPVPGLKVVGGSVYLTDSVVHGGDWPATASVPLPWPGAPAISVEGAGQVEYARGQLLPGAGQPAGPPTVGNATLQTAMVGVGSSGSLQLGGTFTVTAMAGSSGQLLAMVMWVGIAPNLFPPVVEPLWGDPFSGVAIGLAPAAPGASVPFAIAIPAAPQLLNAHFVAQALQVDSPRIRCSAVVGGTLF